MKKSIICAIIVMINCTAIAQVTNEKSPVVLSKQFHGIKQEMVKTVKMPGFDIAKIQEEDRINDLDRTKLYRFGYEFKVDIDIKKEGTLDVLPNGDHLYRVFIESSRAKTLNFVFNEYQVPTGATVYLYNEDRSDILGAYTNVFNRPDEMLGTWTVAGEKVCIEYKEPKNVVGKGILNLSRVIHGYRSVTDIEAFQRPLNSSGDCNQDVDCTVGDDFDDMKDRLKHSVAFVIMDGFVCSGGLINNTNNDRVPYFLTANHCAAGNESSWAFRFNWISPNPSCSTTINSTDTDSYQTTSGATRLAVNSQSDVKLLRLDGGLDSDWDLEFAGWDRTGDIPSSFVVGIHHPAGDIMKVCRENQPPTKREMQFNGNSSAQMWNIADWDLGVTEGGSSGSPLFDSNGRIIGQLAGGAAACEGTNDNNAFDVYGRFDVSWDYGTNQETRLSDWLDPQNTGVMILNSIPNNDMLGIEDVQLESGTSIFPNPSTGIFTIANNSIPDKLEYAVFNVTGQKIDSGEIKSNKGVIDITSSAEGVYFISIKNKNNQASFTKKVLLNN